MHEEVNLDELRWRLYKYFHRYRCTSNLENKPQTQ